MRKRGLRIDVMLNEIEYKKLMNDVEKETVKETIKELRDIINGCTYLESGKDGDPIKDVEKRLTDVMDNLIDML